MSQQKGIALRDDRGTLFVNGVELPINTMSITEDLAIDTQPIIFGTVIKKNGVDQKTCTFTCELTDEKAADVARFKQTISQGQTEEYDIIFTYNTGNGTYKTVLNDCVTQNYTENLDASSGGTVDFSVIFKRSTIQAS